MILVPGDAKVAQFFHLYIPKLLLMIQLFYLLWEGFLTQCTNWVELNPLLIQYKASMDLTCLGSLPKKMTFKATRRTSKDSNILKKNSTWKPKVVFDKVVF